MSVSAVHRIEVRPAPGEPDPAAAALSAALSLPVRTARVYLIQGDLDPTRLDLLADPVTQRATHGSAPALGPLVEVHYKPGVMDPVALSTQALLRELVGVDTQVSTGTRYDIEGAVPEVALLHAARTHLANPVVQDVTLSPYWPDGFPQAPASTASLAHVPLRDLDDDALARLSRSAHLFLSLPEMQAIRAYYQQLGREPTDVELETFAQTWSEHCVHKTLKSTVRYRGEPLPGHAPDADGSTTLRNLLKSTIARATHTLREDEPFRDWLVSVFDDNAGIVKFDDQHGIAIKVETHNHPSAIEPYGGAATGIGGCIRDIMGTGLSAKPIANTDTFAVAPWEDVRSAMGDGRCDENDSLTSPIEHRPSNIPPTVIPPARVLNQVVAGVRDYGNRMGIPTVSGAVLFHEGYLANPLVFAGCVGLIPLDKCFGKAQPGDRIIALGGRTGRDGIHGATFSSAELTDTHADEFAHAVQIGNAITQKQTLDVILRARDHPQGPLFSAITDCGAGGFSSAIGEMGAAVGAHVELAGAPLKYAGLSYREIWISEAQERMILAVHPRKLETLVKLCEAENVEWCDLGQFGHHAEAKPAEAKPAEGKPDEPTLRLRFHGQTVGELSMRFLHEGIPMPTREASWGRKSKVESPMPRLATGDLPTFDAALLSLLAHPNIASKHAIIRQYDHEVQGGSVIKPLVGPHQDGPSDAAVLRPVLTSRRGVALSAGVAPWLADPSLSLDADPYHMALCAIDEAVRNVVCVGADPQRIAILDNFCWPSCGDEHAMGTLVRACVGCHDGAMAYRTPFVSGKDSLNNQFTAEDGRVIAIPPTLLITSLGIVEDVARCVTMDAKAPGNALLLIGRTHAAMGGSHYLQCFGSNALDARTPRGDLTLGPRTARTVAQLIAHALVQSAHDVSDGGLLVAAAEMAFAGRVGLDMNLAAVPSEGVLTDHTLAFSESPGRYLLEIAPPHLAAAAALLDAAGIPFAQIGSFTEHDRLTVRHTAGERLNLPLRLLRDTWLAPLAGV